MLFESGALAIGVSKKRLFTFLLDLEVQDVKPPLSQFNHTLPNREGILKLVRDLNELAPSKLAPESLDKIFDRMWPDLEKKLADAQKITLTLLARRETSDMVAELLDIVRQQSNRLELIELTVTTQTNHYLTGMGSLMAPHNPLAAPDYTQPKPLMDIEEIKRLLEQIDLKVDPLHALASIPLNPSAFASGES